MANVSRQDNTPDPGTPDAFRERMRSQCEEIERYRRAVLRDEGRELSPDEAAREWIERYAGSFAREHGDA